MDDESNNVELRSPARRWFDGFFDPERDPKDKLYTLFLAATIFGACLMLAALLFAAYQLTAPVGQFGDFVGGILNPVLTFLTFMGLFFTIVMQQQELQAANIAKAEAVESLAEEKKRALRQQFEYTFFQMMIMHNTIVGGIDLFIDGISKNGYKSRPRNYDVKGRDCFEYFYKNYREFYADSDKSLERAYEQFWRRRQKDISHYIRYLYNVIRFVDDYDGEIGDRKKYIKLLRAQLSDFELLVLFYLALGRKGSKFVRYIEEYSLFDNLPYERVIEKAHLKLFHPVCYGGHADEVIAYADSRPDPGDY